MSTATIHQISIQRMVCTGCGAEANATCNCGKAYMPKAVRAAEAIKANPEKSDRAIAADIGVSHTTVQEARKATGNHLPVDERTGLDGKTRKIPRPKPKLISTTMLQEANAFHREISNFIGDLQPRFHEWIEDHPEMSDKVKGVLVNALFTCAERLQQFIQQLEGRENGEV